MVSYTYRCSVCGEFDRRAPMGGGGANAPCPTCDTKAKRVYRPPRIGRSPSDPRMRLIEDTKRSACEPQVVDSLPAAGRRSRGASARDPRLAALPRP
ncbi:MAG: zinc ribbon domain-containing protein [Bifidobacteriaceae bacterium]|jgi:putative FmdB family regulatory protein|nr:zinc ribbon domain-containing protein [Bifidobacteriaceae bacterium]